MELDLFDDLHGHRQAAAICLIIKMHVKNTYTIDGIHRTVKADDINQQLKKKHTKNYTQLL